MAATTDFDVIICGGGMVGLSLALALQSSGLRLALIEAQPAPPLPRALQAGMDQAPFDPRVSALTPASSAFLDRLGVWRALESLRVCPYTDMRVWDADGTGAIHFSADEVHAPCLGHIVENNLVCAVLADALATAGKVACLQPESLVELRSELTAGGQAVQVLTLDHGRELRCALLVGADGGNSRVRSLAGFETRAWDYGHRGLVTTVRTEAPHQHTAWQRFMTTGPLAFLPLALARNTTEHYCSIVWSCIPALAEELLALDDEAFARRLEQAFEGRLGRVCEAAPRQAFPLWQRHAGEYIKPGLALIGDAAHTIHPLAGQGVNLGFDDALSLAGVLTRAGTRGEELASLRVLSRYQRERMAANLGMMLVMEGFKRIFASEALALRWARNAGLRAANASGPLKQELMSRAMGLK